jgi:uncharacterized repeat protein (TIGR01451 family)
MKWYVGVALLLMAALLLESGLLAYAMYVMVGLLLVTRLMARSWVGNLSATRECNRQTAEVGEKVAVAVTVRNSGMLPVPWVLLEDLLPGSALNQRAPRLRIKGKRLQIRMIGPGGQAVVRYQLNCRMRGYYQLGPLVLESGDLFGLHRRYRVETEPSYLMVYPKVVAVEGYDLASRRPIGDVRLVHRLYEDPTRIAGVRGYEAGDPLNRVHWGATARTGALQSKIYEPSTLSGATVVLDFHEKGYHRQGEPFRSELAITTTVSLANAVYELGQQVGLVSNGRDAADRLRLEGWGHEFQTRQAARQTAAMRDESDRLQPMIVPTRRGSEQLQHIRECLARVELTDGLTFAQLAQETIGRLPRDATVIAVLPDVPVETALALGTLRRRGLAVTAVLIAFEPNQFQTGYGRLLAEGVRDIRHLRTEQGLATLCSRQWLGASSFYTEETTEPVEERETPDWTQQTPFDIGDLED